MTENSNVISGVFAYAKIQEPAPKYQSDDKEFSIDIIVDKPTYKAFGKQFQKQKGKTVDNDDFEEIYKIKPPFEDQDEQYVLKLRRPAQYKDGTPIPKEYWPKILLKTANGKAVPLVDKLVGNGSKGKVSFEISENSYGTFAKLKSIYVENLVEFKKATTNAGEDFGVEVDYGSDEFEVAVAVETNKQEQKEEKKPAKVTKKPSAPPEDDFDSASLPF